MRLAPIHVDRSTFLTHDDGRLPRLPPVVGQVLAAIRRGGSGAEVASLLSIDPALVATFLALVNSAYYGLPSQISEVRPAVAYLGLPEVERSVLTSALLQYADPSESDALRHFWFHSFHTALCSKLFARTRIGGADDDGLQAAALLHDLGKLVYLKLYPQHYDQMLAHCRATGDRLSDAERHFDLPSHLLFGSIFCERWTLPAIVQRACELHELEHLADIQRAERWRAELTVVCLAHLLCNLASEPLAHDRKAAIRTTVGAVLGIGDREFLLLMAEVYELRTAAESCLSSH